MHGFHTDIEHDTIANTNFRKVLYTGKHMQLVLMTLQPKEAIGLETHHNNDQFFRFEKGMGLCTIDDNQYAVKDGSAIIVPAGSKHNIINTSETETLHMYTIYSPAHHKDGTIHHSKEEAESDDEEFDGVTSE